MLFLDAENQIILATLRTRLEADKKDRLKAPLEVKGQDFDNTNFRVTGKGLDSKDNLDGQKEIITVSIHVLCGDILIKHGMDEYLKRVYGSYVVAPEKDFTATLEFCIDGIDEKEKEKILLMVPCLKRYVMMTPFAYAFDKFVKGEKFDNVQIPYRTEENIYIITFEKTLNVVYSVKFNDPDDIVLARVFLQEFADTRRDKALGKAPSVSFSQGVKPLELQGIKSSEPDDPKQLKEYGFVSLSLRDYMCTEDMRVSTLDTLLQFRNYLHYHLKCSKAYMHIRMRSRVARLLEDLETCKDKNGFKIKMKTFQGKTFESQ